MYINAVREVGKARPESAGSRIVVQGGCISIRQNNAQLSVCAVAWRHAKDVSVVALGCRPSACPRDQARCCVGVSSGTTGLWLRGDVMGADLGEVAEVDGRDRKDRQPPADRDHRSVGPVQAPVSVAAHELGHAAQVRVGQSGQLEGVLVTDAHAVQEGSRCRGPEVPVDQVAGLATTVGGTGRMSLLPDHLHPCRGAPAGLGRLRRPHRVGDGHAARIRSRNRAPGRHVYKVGEEGERAAAIHRRTGVCPRRDV